MSVSCGVPSPVFTLQMPAGQARFEISAASVEQPVVVGQYARASVTVRNTGTAMGFTGIMGDTETTSGQVVGHWVSGTTGGLVATTPDILPLEDSVVPLRSEGTIASNFAGQTLYAAFVLTSGQSTRVPFTVS